MQIETNANGEPRIGLIVLGSGLAGMLIMHGRADTDSGEVVIDLDDTSYRFKLTWLREVMEDGGRGTVEHFNERFADALSAAGLPPLDVPGQES